MTLFEFFLKLWRETARGSVTAFIIFYVLGASFAFLGLNKITIQFL